MAKQSKAASKKTEYLVLAEVDGAERAGESGRYLLLSGSYLVSNSDQACRAAVEKLGGGTYVAVPARSFRPEEYLIEQTPKIVKVVSAGHSVAVPPDPAV